MAALSKDRTRAVNHETLGRAQHVPVFLRSHHSAYCKSEGNYLDLDFF